MERAVRACLLNWPQRSPNFPPTLKRPPSGELPKARSRYLHPLPAPQAQQTESTPAVPTLKSIGFKIATPGGAGANVSSEKAVRRSVSIAAFPQPPKLAAGSRIGTPSGRPSLGGTLVTANLDKSLPREPQSASGIGTPSTAPAGPSSVKTKRIKQTPSSVALHTAFSRAPSLLNGSGETVPVSAGTSSAGRGSGSLLGLPSPPRSRSSSAEGSYSTTATTFEDVDETPAQPRGRDEMRGDDEQRGRSSGKEAKGNVIVSVRVRPDEGGDMKSEGEWMVDGRRSLVAFKGREGGDYFYGKNISMALIPARNTNEVFKIMFSQLTTTMIKSTKPAPSDSSAASWRAITAPSSLTA